MSYMVKDGVFIPMIKGEAIASPITMAEYINDLSLIMKARFSIFLISGVQQEHQQDFFGPET